MIKAESENLSRQKQLEKIEIFRQLHRPDDPVILYNIWDAGSAKAVAKSGARAIATSSWAVAKSRGFDDGERIPLELAIQNLRQIVEAVDLPVTFDIESAYAEDSDEVGRNIILAVEAGAVGCNFEDSLPGSGAVRDTATQVKRISGARRAVRVRDVPFFINARCDLFFQGDMIPHDERLLRHVLDRAYAYADAGADGLFVPGLVNVSLIAQLAEKSPLPVNILAGPTTSLKVLAENGVARVSYGASPYIAALAALEQAAGSAGGQ